MKVVLCWWKSMLLAAHAGTFDNGWIFLQPKTALWPPGNEVQKTDKKHGRIKGPPQYVLHPRPGLGQALVSLGAPRMPTNLLHHDPQNRTQKNGKNMAAIKGSHKGISTVSPRMPELILKLGLPQMQNHEVKVGSFGYLKD